MAGGRGREGFFFCQASKEGRAGASGPISPPASESFELSGVALGSRFLFVVGNRKVGARSGRSLFWAVWLRPEQSGFGTTPSL